MLGIVDSWGNEVVSYSYDAWGNVLSTTGSMASTLGKLNVLHYRGYVCDDETGLYYLTSRFYNPEWGRFINAYVFVSTGQGLLGSNMFAYCLNNPVNMTDSDGRLAKWISGLLNVASGVTQVFAGAALAFASSPTVVGVGAGAALIANGVGTIIAGGNELYNGITGSTWHEENYIRTGVRELGNAIGGEKGASIATAVYDCADLAANIYSVYGGGKEIYDILYKVSKGGKYTKYVFQGFLPSKFTDMYKVERTFSAVKEVVTNSKPWFRLINEAGAIIDTVKNIISFCK